jgi:hypothetical protein
VLQIYAFAVSAQFDDDERAALWKNTERLSNAIGALSF